MVLSARIIVMASENGVKNKTIAQELGIIIQPCLSLCKPYIIKDRYTEVLSSPVFSANLTREVKLGNAKILHSSHIDKGVFQYDVLKRIVG